MKIHSDSCDDDNEGNEDNVETHNDSCYDDNGGNEDNVETQNDSCYDDNDGNEDNVETHNDSCDDDNGGNEVNVETHNDSCDDDNVETSNDICDDVNGGQDQDQDQDSLLVKRRNDNHSPGPVIRELVPNSHQRSELRNTILCIFSGWDQRIGEGIPIPDSLGKETTFINICIGYGSLKCQRVLISTTPSFEDKVICWYTGFTFKTLYSNISLLSFLLFLRDSHFNCPRMPVMLPVS